MEQSLDSFVREWEHVVFQLIPYTFVLLLLHA